MPDQQCQHYDVAVVGAGMVGLTAALALCKQGMKVALVDAREGSAQALVQGINSLCKQGYDNRVSALTFASQRIFENLGVWQKMAATRVSPYREMDVWDGAASGRIHFSCDELHQPCLGHIVENRVVVAALLEAVLQSNITLVQGAEVIRMTSEQEGKTLHCADARTLSAQLVVAADGAMSKVRKLAALPMWQWDYGHHAIVATVVTEKPHNACARQRFTDDGPLAFLPLDAPYTSSIVWSTSPQAARDLMATDDTEFASKLAQAFERCLGAVVQVESRALFPLRQRHAIDYVQPGVAMIGDAAHTIHPLAGQGVNLGLLDAAALTDTVAAAAARGVDFASLSELKKYQRARQADNLQMSAMMQGFKWLFDPQPAPVTLLRSLGMNLLDRATPLKQHIVQQAMGLSDDLPTLAKC
ncbi:MAG: UbiH/UbiF/VisC/COQ6 family ubiquinone biosynthesis hydroxylase [Pseudomonadales bacterium]